MPLILRRQPGGRGIEITDMDGERLVIKVRAVCDGAPGQPPDVHLEFVGDPVRFRIVRTELIDREQDHEGS